MTLTPKKILTDSQAKTSLKRYNLKLILLGDGGVGKTSLVERFVSAKFDVDYKITIGVNVMSKIIPIGNGDVAVLAINDVAGQPRFETLRTVFYGGTQTVLAVCDLTRKQSLENLENVWIPELLGANPPKKELPPVKILLVGNKCDLDDLRVISPEEIGEIAARIRAKFPQVSVLAPSLETSAKDNVGVDDAFKRLAEQYITQLRQMYPGR